MDAPVDFQNRLSRMFDNRLRIRWSNQRKEWHIEYKVGRSQLPNFFVSTYDDAAIRASQGYAFLMAIREGDRMPCPRCGYTVKVPKFHVAQAVCDYCRLNGRDGRYPAVYFPLEGDALIQYLCRIDPLRGYRDKMHLQADLNNERILEAKERQFKNDIASITLDNYNKLVGIPSWGYTGKHFKG
jgi:hypothetical protein